MCGCIYVFVVSFLLEKMAEFGLFSLEEDDDYGNMFITQESSNNSGIIDGGVGESKELNEEFLSVKHDDFTSPCALLVSNPAHYSDISDDEVFEKMDISTNNVRYVY